MEDLHVEEKRKDDEIPQVLVLRSSIYCILHYCVATKESSVLLCKVELLDNSSNTSMYVCMYMYVWSLHIAEYGSTGQGCQSCSWSGEQGKLIFPCPRSRLRIWSRDTGSAVPSRVSLLISILRLNLVLTHGILPDFRGDAHLFI